MTIPNHLPGLKPEAAIKPAAPENFRAVKWNEAGRRGDFNTAGREGFEPWEGPGGFRADAHVKTLCRKPAGPSL